MICGYCKEPLEENPPPQDFIGMGDEPEDMHRECFMRSVLGSLGHMMGFCSCVLGRGKGIEDPPRMTRREAAKAAYVYWNKSAELEKFGWSLFPLDRMPQSMFTLPVYCLSCGAYLAGSWTVHEPECALNFFGPSLCPEEHVEAMRLKRRDRGKSV
jgi:hypothetical protein